MSQITFVECVNCLQYVDGSFHDKSLQVPGFGVVIVQIFCLFGFFCHTAGVCVHACFRLTKEPVFSL